MDVESCRIVDTHNWRTGSATPLYPPICESRRIVDTHNLRAQGRAGATTYRYDDVNRLMEAVTPEGTSSFDR